MSKVTSSTLIKFKQEGKKFTALTAYDASFASAFDSEGVDVLLVGDSLGMVLQGHDDTLPVTTADIAYHTACVKRGISRALLIADMPFMSYATPEQTMTNAAILMQAGASMVKLEGGHWLLESVKMLTERGIPVCAHLGLTPQSVNVFGGFKVQGRDADNAQRILDEAKAIQAAGAQLLVVECIPASLAKAITEALTIPVIGIGAGADTDGQILVMHDVLGISSGYIPRFSKNYLKQTGEIRSAIKAYIDEVANGSFPAEEHTFN
ncbi:3-methyl-2-oxobutanoate hydroxymethyltransferase [Shewanella sp. SR43-4]|jgi:3-methyl-2-oxobutanoate hydroxymethyltransferase|uniref:3-methyl-2-oxobutanoate hydroxymethyltransferase n=1 Tax=Shewanella vesiculosa TaxID=518738 RepID=A0ABV0FSY9_9GAMM|nr:MULTISPECIES: 3-methyl-2-oxobutanoate hydroxymethyltransferase [Shewanella]NCQ45430.1 3-methyl-2-oxobutanoate hydroxymethyltransferase [Shewanella frigidimarina]MBB1316123.1 3-methyl-2-oxobutanoate hydroxymethyltransferase [Shewanella sp. SR43-4]NCO71489.1 3-methyl-2-oxobutanoate hydroxymethyltransferase [Shewanella vesiculosa]NCP36699.1 3-methyl-2-oxobutanoate hydroxymethyltransferase [Shewanella vesiculosa]NCP69208.1 3-methyl-2-oxobutanoate hydroxymethyltransferase [Shewanella vesiculosa]|tara:strand:- start:2276 stop:3070 length:795 start_codon:yes stop_codon:yes gene_type:complete